jgi:putative endonuclease
VTAGESREATDPGEWNRRVGRLGETLVAKFLRFQGMKILYRNYRAPKGGEVDIVCRDGDLLVFVEVKTRSSTAYGRPGRAVDRDKQALITRGAMAWLRELDYPDIVFRFDVVEVVLEQDRAPHFQHLEKAFHLPEGLRY